MNCHYISDFWIFLGGFMLGAFLLATILVLNLWRLAYEREQRAEYLKSQA